MQSVTNGLAIIIHASISKTPESDLVCVPGSESKYRSSYGQRSYVKMWVEREGMGTR